MTCGVKNHVNACGRKRGHQIYKKLYLTIVKSREVGRDESRTLATKRSKPTATAANRVVIRSSSDEDAATNEGEEETVK